MIGNITELYFKCESEVEARIFFVVMHENLKFVAVILNFHAPQLKQQILHLIDKTTYMKSIINTVFEQFRYL